MLRRIINRYGRTKLLLLLLDLLSLNIAALVLIWGRYCSGLFGPIQYFPWERYIVFVVATIVQVIIFRFKNLYKNRVYTRFFDELVLMLESEAYCFLFMAIVLFLLKSQPLAEHIRINMVLFFTLTFLFAVIERGLVFPALSRQMLESGLLIRKVLIVGAGKNGEKLLDHLEKHPYLGLDVVGFLDDDKSKQDLEIQKRKVLGTMEDVVTIARQYGIDEIFLAAQSMGQQSLLKAIDKCKAAGLQINVASVHFDIIHKKRWNTEYEDFRSVHLFPHVAPLYKVALKRAIDVVCAIFLIIVLSPMFVIIAGAIRLTSKGPVFYKATSIGKQCEPFTFYKFRSMYNDGDNSAHKELVREIIQNGKSGEKLKQDSRITIVGRILRKYSLDEFGQLINVLKGDMSFVGPRPCTTYEFELYQDWHKERFRVLPGMTGLWQVLGRNEVTFNDMIIMDLYYAENVSFWLDLKILLKTVWVVFAGKGAY